MLPEPPAISVSPLNVSAPAYAPAVALELMRAPLFEIPVPLILSGLVLVIDTPRKSNTAPSATATPPLELPSALDEPTRSVPLVIEVPAV